MSAVQTTYTENIRGAIEGAIADTTGCDIRSYSCEGADGIGFGVAVQQGTDADEAKIGIAANKFVGVTVKDITQPPGNSDSFKQGDHMGVLQRGTIWIKVEDAVAPGNDVTAKTTTGALSSKAVTATQLKIDGARWMTKAAAGGLAKLYLSGALPSA